MRGLYGLLYIKNVEILKQNKQERLALGKVAPACFSTFLFSYLITIFLPLTIYKPGWVGF